MSKAIDNPVFSIGHSTHSVECFIDLLLQQKITALCDIRSRPYSRMSPQFNREDLKQALHPHGIQYVFLGDELGARSLDPACYVKGRVQYDRLAMTGSFKHGLKRIQEGMSNYRVAILCAEKEPLECHRTVLVGRHLSALGIDVKHILADGSLESQEDVLLRLARLLDVKVDEHHMFCTREELLADAYRLQEERIAYGPSIDSPNDSSNGLAMGLSAPRRAAG